jgi:hypothetical protein
MKKILTIALILAITLSLLTACRGKDNNGGGNNNPGSTNGGNNNEAFEFRENYILNNLKEFHLVYNITTHNNGETDTAAMEQIRTSAGYYYATDDSGDGLLLIKNGDSYDFYSNDGEGTYANTGMQYTKEMAEAMMVGMTAYMQAYAAYGSKMNKTGNTTVAGRACVEYTFNFTVPYQYKATYCIDKETGVCLKIKMDMAGAGQKVGYEFEATKFLTSGVSLPSYN